MLKHKNEQNEVSITELWRVVVYGLQDIWPESRTRVSGQNMGDVWELSYVAAYYSVSCFFVALLTSLVIYIYMTQVLA